jgi:hypothetical protein
LGPRTRRAIAGVGVLVFLAFYIVAAIAISERLPNVAWIRLLFFAVAGTAWGVPLFPLFAWSERGGRRKRDTE